MSYDPTTDFLGLLRLTSGGVRSERMPGLDWLVSALNRMGLFAVSVSQTAPTNNQATTVWVQPAIPSWTAECTVWLWNDTLPIPVYQAATPALWLLFLAGINTGYSFQSITADNTTILAGTTLAAIQRTEPVTTHLILPVLGAQWVTGKSLRIADFYFSPTLAAHTISLTTTDGATIMGQATWTLLSTVDSRASVDLYASPDLSSWILT